MNANIGANVDIEAILALPPEQRRQLADLIENSLGPQDDLGLTEAEWAEIERRLDEHDRDPSSALTLGEFKARLARHR